MCTFDFTDYSEYDGHGNPDSLLLKKVIASGFKPIGITIMICEETFIFKSKQEASAAAEKFLPEGWWYEFSEWIEERNKYVKKFYKGDEDLAPTVYWLDKNFEPKSRL